MEKVLKKSFEAKKLRTSMNKIILQYWVYNG